MKGRRGVFEGGGPKFDGEKFPAVGGKPSFGSQMMKEEWKKTQAGQAMDATIDAWLKKHGAEYGLQDGWLKAYAVQATPVEGSKRMLWNVKVDDGKAGTDPKKASGVGKLFMGNFQIFLDPEDNLWSIKKETFETKDPPAGGGKESAAEKLARLKKEKGFCEPPCKFEANMFDPRFCKQCQKFEKTAADK